MSEWRRGNRDGRVTLVLVGITVLAVIARLAWLGARVAHWDEGRVGYDVLRFMATGAYEYRPIVHGPFLAHVNRLVFETLGPNDFTMRLAVAVIGGLFPLAAWLYRDHLADREVVALSLFLAADPILLYYSRFMRNDVLVAAFLFTALGCLLRARKTGRARYLYGAAGLFALAVTAKENAILYPLAIGGAVLLLFDHRLFLARASDRPSTTVLIERVRGTAQGLYRWRLPLVVAVVEFLVIVVFFYAPRAATPGGFGLWQAMSDPTMLPRVIEAGSYDAGKTLVDSWVTGTHQDHPFLPFLGHYLEVLGTASGALALLAILGFLTDRYTGDRPRDIVALGFYWGAASVIGYPIAIDIKSAWAVVHAVVPFAIPAAAGIGLIYGWGRDALLEDDRVGVGLAALVLFLVAAQVAATGVSTVYLHPQQESNIMVQYAQPEGEMRPALDAVHRASRENQQGLDVLWYGEHFHVANKTDMEQLPVRGGEWYNRLPMPWYLERFGSETNSTKDPIYAADTVATERPPVVLTRGEETGEITLEDDGYRDFCYEFRQFDEEIVFYFDEGYAPSDPAAETRCDLENE